MAYLRFFFGTPQRFLCTLGGVAVVFGLLFPRELGAALNDLLVALMPLVQAVMVLMVVLIGLGIMVKKSWGNNKGGKG